MFVKINGETHYLWRVVDHEGDVLESYVTRTRDKQAAFRFMKKALKRHGSPEAITTDGLKSYGTALRELGTPKKQEIGRRANNRVENSHLPFRRRERVMLRFRGMHTLQKLASVHANAHNHFASKRHLVDRQPPHAGGGVELASISASSRRRSKSSKTRTCLSGISAPYLPSASIFRAGMIRDRLLSTDNPVRSTSGLSPSVKLPFKSTHAESIV